jgi:hypothetical protein
MKGGTGRVGIAPAPGTPGTDVKSIKPNKVASAPSNNSPKSPQRWADNVVNPKTSREGPPLKIEIIAGKMSYKGGSYVVHTGRRGGKYIKVGDRKIYLRK